VSHPHPELTAPPPLAPNGLRVVPLGGLGEVGRNMAVLEHQGRLLIIDCGVLFPEDNQPGVDLILPDFTSIRDRYADVVAVVLTHGHEDHIGAVPYLLKERPDIPLVGSQLTLALIPAGHGQEAGAKRAWQLPVPFAKACGLICCRNAKTIPIHLSHRGSNRLLRWKSLPILLSPIRPLPFGSPVPLRPSACRFDCWGARPPPQPHRLPDSLVGANP